MIADSGGSLWGAMRDESVEALASIDTHHWYFRARNDLISDAIDQLGMSVPRTRTVLDVGCGPGGTTMLLAAVGQVTAIDPSPAAAPFVARRIPSARFLLGGVDDLDALVGEEEFDLVCCFGALNQRSVSQPDRAVAALARRVAPGGGLMLAEPADERLRRQMDAESETAVRFDLRDLCNSVRSTQLEVVTARYVHGWAWPVARLLAWNDQRRPKSPQERPAEMSTEAFARTAYLLSRVERRLAHRLEPPCGTGCWVVAQRPGAPG